MTGIGAVSSNVPHVVTTAKAPPPPPPSPSSVKSAPDGDGDHDGSPDSGSSTGKIVNIAA